MATFTINLLTGEKYLFSGNFSNSGSTTFSGLTSSSNGLTTVGHQVKLGGVLTQNTVFNGGASKFNLRYNGDYSSNFTNRSLVDKGYVDLQISAHTPTWLTLTNIPAWLTGATLSAFEVGHKHSQYLTGVTWTIVSGRPAWLTGTTLQRFQTGHTHSYNNLTNKPNLFTGNTFVGSGGTHIHVNGNEIIIYSVTPSGETTSWTNISNKPAWLTGATLAAFETGHTHSYNKLTNKLSGGTGIAIVNNVITVTGTTVTDTTLQLLDISGNTEINTISPTPIIWTTIQFSGTSLNFTGGSKIIFTQTGAYSVSFMLDYSSVGAGTKTIGAVVRKNGNTDLLPLTSAGFSVDSNTVDGNNLAPAYKANFSSGDYIELLAYRTGSSGSVLTNAGASWITVLKENI